MQRNIRYVDRVEALRHLEYTMDLREVVCGNACVFILVSTGLETL